MKTISCGIMELWNNGILEQRYNRISNIQLIQYSPKFVINEKLIWRMKNENS
jgi:hypothetical protein